MCWGHQFVLCVPIYFQNRAVACKYDETYAGADEDAADAEDVARDEDDVDGGCSYCWLLADPNPAARTTLQTLN